MSFPLSALNIKRFDDSESLAIAVADAIVAAARSVVAEGDVFHLALAGGSTPKRCYELLRHRDIDWQRLHVWFGDERCLPVGDTGRNDTMADVALLQHVPIPTAQIHRMPAEFGPVAGAEAYAGQLVPTMDLVLLGMGEDGHTASLFPGNVALHDNRFAVPVFDAPKPPPERISMGLAYLNAAARRIVMVAGAGKREAWEAVKRGEQLPAAMLRQPEWYSTLE